jgi:hypothetical protein
MEQDMQIVDRKVRSHLGTERFRAQDLMLVDMDGWLDGQTEYGPVYSSVIAGDVYPTFGSIVKTPSGRVRCQLICQDDRPRPGSDVICPITIGDSNAYRAKFEVENENEVEVAQTL